MLGHEGLRKLASALIVAGLFGFLFSACGKSSSGKDSSISISESDATLDGVVDDTIQATDSASDDLSSSADGGLDVRDDDLWTEDSVDDDTMAPDTTPDATPDDATPDDAVESDGSVSDDGFADPLDLLGDAPTAGAIYIYLTGDLTPQDFKDKLSGQTPSDYVIAISRYSILTSADDPAPYLCFDHGDTPAVADLSKDTLVGFCSTVSVPSASYTHGRVKVDYVRYSVTGNLHVGAIVLPGSFTFFRAYSKGKYDGIDYLPGQGYIEFTGDYDFKTPYYFPEPPSVPNVKTELVDGEFLMTFPFTNPLPIVQNGSELHWARFHWQIHEAFRWKDANTLTYVKSVWDANSVPAGSELIMMFGVSGYYVTSSVD
ncbi:MAG: hypothetical protein KC609_00185 [Myxococcales bacterium]|nr:hypothetical protein [Myxococcales bacterium]